MKLKHTLAVADEPVFRVYLKQKAPQCLVLFAPVPPLQRPRDWLQLPHPQVAKADRVAVILQFQRQAAVGCVARCADPLGIAKDLRVVLH